MNWVCRKGASDKIQVFFPLFVLPMSLEFHLPLCRNFPLICWAKTFYLSFDVSLPCACLPLKAPDIYCLVNPSCEEG